MPKQPIQEIFSQGLVTSRPAHMLAQGELTRADHCVYRENNVALQRAPDHGYYSPSSPAILGTNTITGILMGNFEAEEYPDQLICRAGDDLFSSSIIGASNNVFEPITSPGKSTATFGETPTAAANTVVEGATTLYPYSTGVFDGKAIVGRAIYSSAAFPLGQTTLITQVTESGGHVTSITVSAPAAVGETTPQIYFAPKCTLANSYVSAASIGFSVLAADEVIMTAPPQITSCKNVTGGAAYLYLLQPPTTTAFNLYSVIGRRVTVQRATESIHNYPGTSTPYSTAPRSILQDDVGSVEFATIEKIDVTSGNVTQLHLSAKIIPNWPVTAVTDLIVKFMPSPGTATITAVADVIEEGSNTPVYTSFYTDWFPTAGEKALIFSGGLHRLYKNLGAASFDGLSWDGTMFLWDGVNPTIRLEYRARKTFDATAPTPRSIVARPAGLLPVIDTPTVVVHKRPNGEESKGVWNVNLPNGIYWILVTEAYIPTKNQLDEIFNPLLVNNLLESAYLASNNITGQGTGSGLVNPETGNLDPTIAPIVADASGHAGRPVPFNISDREKNYVSITLPAPRNNGINGYLATHWCIYIAGAGDSYLTPPPFSSFTRTHCESMTRYTAGQIIELKDTQMTQFWLADTPNSWIPTPINPPGIGFEWASQTRGERGITQAWKGYAGGENHDKPGYMAAGDWHVEGVASGIYAGKAVSGVRVGLEVFEQSITQTALGKSVDKVWHAISLQAGNSTIPDMQVRTANEMTNYGGPHDTWQLDPTTANWQDLRVRIRILGAARNKWLIIRNPKVTVYYTTTSINFNGPAYRCVTYRSQVGGLDISDPSTLPPPRATMGDTFQGSLVLNDITNPSFIRYSLPDQPERFPQPYRMKMGTKRKGKITALKAFKQVLIVGMERAIKRVNYLPKETDTDFTQGTGLSHEDLSATHGIVGPNAIVDFDMPGMGPMLAYVSTIGLRMTNGAETRALNTDVLLKDYIHPDYWYKCILKAFPNQKWLILYYVPKDSTHGVLSKCFVYSYSEDHIKGGASIVLSGNPVLTGPLAVTGPCDCYVVDACDIVINSSPQVATTDGDFIYIEDSSEDWGPVQTVTGPDDATKVNRVNVPYIKTRDIFPAGFTQEANIGSVYLMHETKGSQYVVTGTTSTQGSTTLAFNSGWGGNTPKIGERVIHGGWDSPPSVLSLDDEDGTTITVSAPAVRAFTGSATFDTGVVLVRVNAAQFSEDEVPILTEYRSTSVGVGQPFIMDATANRFSMEIIKTENPNTGDLNDLGENMSIIGIVYHASPAGETNLHAN